MVTGADKRYEVAGSTGPQVQALLRLSVHLPGSYLRLHAAKQCRLWPADLSFTDVHLFVHMTLSICSPIIP